MDKYYDFNILKLNFTSKFEFKFKNNSNYIIGTQFIHLIKKYCIEQLTTKLFFL